MQTTARRVNNTKSCGESWECVSDEIQPSTLKRFLAAVGREHPRLFHRVAYRLRQHVHGTLATCHLLFAAPTTLSRFPCSRANRGVRGCSKSDSKQSNARQTSTGQVVKFDKNQSKSSHRIRVSNFSCTIAIK